jgi:nucleoside-diphosphate-sugar epimerase
MKILVTGGTGLIGAPTVTKLLEAGHSVRLLSRNAEQDAGMYVGGVEAFNGSVADSESISGAAEGCDVVVHIAGIAVEEPPEETFQSVNIDGTYNLVREATCSKVRRLIFVSSLGADRGQSEYHKSKLQAERRVQQFEGEWVILRPGNVIGPSDSVTSTYIWMVRNLPAVPVVDSGDQMAQPIWAGDLAEAIVRCVDRDGLEGRILELGGEEQVSANGLIDKIARLLGKEPNRLPVPSWAALLGTNLAQATGLKLPFSSQQVTMLLEGNVVEGTNALTNLLGIEPTSLDVALRKLVDGQPAMTPDEGVGELHFQQAEAVLGRVAMSPDELFALFSAHVSDVFGGTPAEPEGGTRLQFGDTMTLALPLRGDVQVRVVERTPASAICLTVEGHPLAGAVVFEALEVEDSLVFRVRTYDRPSNALDGIAMETVGRPMQEMTWRHVVENVAHLAGVESPSLFQETETVGDAERGPIEAWLQELYEGWMQSPEARAKMI